MGRRSVLGRACRKECSERNMWEGGACGEIGACGGKNVRGERGKVIESEEEREASSAVTSLNDILHVAHSSPHEYRGVESESAFFTLNTPFAHLQYKPTFAEFRL